MNRTKFHSLTSVNSWSAVKSFVAYSLICNPLSNFLTFFVIASQLLAASSCQNIVELKTQPNKHIFCMQLDLQFFIKLLRLKLFCVCLTTELQQFCTRSQHHIFPKVVVWRGRPGKKFPCCEPDMSGNFFLSSYEFMTEKNPSFCKQTYNVKPLKMWKLGSKPENLF